VGDAESRLAFLAVYGVWPASQCGDLLRWSWLAWVDEILASFLRRLRIVGMLSLLTMWVLTLSIMYVFTPDASCTLEITIKAYNGSLGLGEVRV
jgi:hypothetical protein